MSATDLTKLFGIQYPLIQGGMVWVSGGKLAAAVSNAGALGLIGAGSMNPELLKEHIHKAQALTSKPFGINLPLLYDKTEEQIQVALENSIRIFFTSAGGPKKYTAYLKSKGAIVVHVTSNPLQAEKAAEAGVHAVVCEGFEAGGHNGREEITTMALIPQVKKRVSIPIIAAGGIASGAGMLAAMALGASGVQMGTRFLMTKESSAHDDFKNYILKSNFDSTKLLMKKTIPVRLLQNEFSKKIEAIEERFHGEELKNQLLVALGKNRAKKGMLYGDILEGELEMGQIGSLIKSIPTCAEVVQEIIRDYELTFRSIQSF